MSTSGMFSISGDTMILVGGYHEYIGGCLVHQGMFSTPGDVQYIEVFNRN